MCSVCNVALQVIGGNKGGVVALVEGLKAFVPFSQVSSVGSQSYYKTLLYPMVLLHA